MLKEQSIFAFNVAALLSAFQIREYQISFGEAYRTPEQEAIDISKGISKTSNSMHLKRLAIDLNIFKNGVQVTDAKELIEFGNYWRSLNTLNRWGGDWNKNGIATDEKFSDPSHFEMQLPV